MKTTNLTPVAITLQQDMREHWRQRTYSSGGVYYLWTLDLVNNIIPGFS